MGLAYWGILVSTGELGEEPGFVLHDSMILRVKDSQEDGAIFPLGVKHRVQK